MDLSICSRMLYHWAIVPYSSAVDYDTTITVLFTQLANICFSDMIIDHFKQWAPMQVQQSRESDDDVTMLDISTYWIFTTCLLLVLCFVIIHAIWTRDYSSVVEHSTADREVHGSNPCGPLFFLQSPATCCKIIQIFFLDGQTIGWAHIILQGHSITSYLLIKYRCIFLPSYLNNCYIVLCLQQCCSRLWNKQWLWNKQQLADMQSLRKQLCWEKRPFMTYALGSNYQIRSKLSIRNIFGCFNGEK